MRLLKYFYHCKFSSKKFALCFNFVPKLLECVQNRCWKNVRHAKMWSIHQSVFFKDTVVILRHLCYCIRNIFWYQILATIILGPTHLLILYIRDNSVLLDCAQHAIYQHTMANLDLFQMSLRSYLLFLKCLVARRCISCDLLQPYFHCFSYSLVPSFLSPATFQTSFQKL